MPSGPVNVPAMEVPIPFIQTGTDGRMTVNEQVQPILSQAKDPIAVISIAGKYRTGKSYIMNRFFQTNAGFSLGPTIQSTTKGIWLWARPHPLDPNRTLVLLDTEGLHDVEKGDETHDMKLFSLAILLSNCLVYNAVGTLDDVIIQQLHLVTSLTEHIKTKEGQDEDGNHFNKYFPSFFLLLRDFFLDLKLEGIECTPDEYMENALKLKPGQSPKLFNYNIPRQCIRAFFPQRKCFTLCKPVDDDAKLRTLDNVSEAEIKQEFLEKAKEATDAILMDAKPMNVDGNPINGTRFLALAQLYVKALNDGAVPCISSAVDLLRNNECQKALAESVTLFQQTMDKQLKDKLPVGDATLTEIQKAGHGAAVEHFRQQALFDEDGEYRDKLLAELEQGYQDQITANNEASMQKCEAVLSQCFAVLDGQIKAGGYMEKGCHQKYKTDRDAAVQRYNDIPNKGPVADYALSQFIERRNGEEQAIINIDKALTEKDKQLAKERQKLKNEQDRAKAAEAEQRTLMQDFMRKQNEHQHVISKMQEDFRDKQDKMMKEYDRDRKQKENEYRRLLSEKMDAQAEQYKQLIEGIRNEQKKAVSRLPEPVRDYGPYGGGCGSYFTDRNSAKADIKEIHIWCGEIIDGIAVKYGGTWGPHHGGKGGSKKTISLAHGEHITDIEVVYGCPSTHYGNVISKLRFVSNAKTYGWYGIKDTSCQKANIDCRGRKLAYISGRAGKYLTQLNFSVK